MRKRTTVAVKGRTPTERMNAIARAVLTTPKEKALHPVPAKPHSKRHA